MSNKNQVLLLQEHPERGVFSTAKMTATIIRGVSDAEVAAIFEMLENNRRRTVSTKHLAKADEIHITFERAKTEC